MRPITKAAVRRSLAWCGVGIGAAAIAAYIFVLFGSLTLRWNHRAVSLERGALVFGWNVYQTWTVNFQPYEAGVYLDGRPGLGWRWAPGWSEPPQRTVGAGFATLPLWIFVLLGLAAAYRLLPEGPPPGRCRCGYDLRASRPGPDGAVRCPECGTVGQRVAESQEKPPAGAGGSNESG